MRGITPAVWGAALGALLLGWSLLAFLTPELASIIAVFGSPLLAFLVIVGILSTGSQRSSQKSGRPIAELKDDRAIRDRVLKAAGGRCVDCGSRESLALHQVLPIGRVTRHVDRRFVPLCPVCLRSRWKPASQPEH
jgi:hypothetical protein